VNAMAAQRALPKHILVFGATGLIGKPIVEEIYNAKSSFGKIGIFTSKSTAKSKPDELNSWKEKGVDVIVGDVNSEVDVARAYEGAYSSIITIPHLFVDYKLTLVPQATIPLFPH
jgi:uncharacterized protein YbjT (DUF2867 family)